MTSSSLLPSKYFDKLQVNRLKANDIKSDNIYPERPSYLFSAVFNNATFDRNESGGILTITKNDIESIIQFSDRPFRQTQNIDFDIFISLFEVTGNNSFEEDPPNGVLTHSEEQRTYIIRLLNSENDKATFSLELLPGETHNLNSVQGRMNLFVDSFKFAQKYKRKRRGAVLKRGGEVKKQIHVTTGFYRSRGFPLAGATVTRAESEAAAGDLRPMYDS